MPDIIPISLYKTGTLSLKLDAYTRGYAISRR